MLLPLDLCSSPLFYAPSLFLLLTGLNTPTSSSLPLHSSSFLHFSMLLSLPPPPFSFVFLPSQVNQWLVLLAEADEEGSSSEGDDA